MKKVREFLQKLGILRVGGRAAVYTDARERPLEFSRDEMDPTPPPSPPSPDRQPGS